MHYGLASSGVMRAGDSVGGGRLGVGDEDVRAVPRLALHTGDWLIGATFMLNVRAAG